MAPLQIEQTMNNYRRRPPPSTQDVGVYTEEARKMKERASQQRTRNWNGRVTDMAALLRQINDALMRLTPVEAATAHPNTPVNGAGRA
jgi:hypothetical protein